MGLKLSESFAGCNPKNKSLVTTKNSANTNEDDKIYFLSSSNIILASFERIEKIIFTEDILVSMNSFKDMVICGDIKGKGHILVGDDIFSTSCGEKIQDCCFLELENKDYGIFCAFNAITLYNYNENKKYQENFDFLISSVATIGNKILIGTSTGTIVVLIVGIEEDKLIIYNKHSIDAHLDSITDIKIYSDRFVATSSQDYNIKIWEISQLNKDLHLFQTLNGHTDWVNSISWHNGILYSSSSDKTIRVWESNINSENEHFYTCTDIIGGSSEFMESIIFQNRLFGHAKSGGIDKLLPAEYFLSGHLNEITDLDWNDELLLTGSLDRTSRIFYNKKERGRPQTHGFPLTSAKFLRSDRLRIISSGQETILRIYEATQKFFTDCLMDNSDQMENDKFFKKYEISNYAYSAYLSELNLTNEISESACSKPLSEDSLSTDVFQEIKKIYGHFFEIKNIAVGKTIILSCNRSAVSKYAGIFAWTTDGVKSQYLTCHDLGIQRISISADERMAITVSRDKTSCLYSIKDGKLEIIKRFFDHGRVVWDCGFSRDNLLMSTCSRDGKIIIYDLGTLNIRKCLETAVEITSLCFSPKDDYLAIGTSKGVLKILNYDLEELYEIRAVGKSINILRFDETGSKIAVGGSDGILRIVEFKV